jgi:hypothetical protein
MSIMTSDPFHTAPSGENRGTTMTPARFFSELQAIQHPYKWFLTKEKQIRATFGSETDDRLFNPITAVAFAQTGEYFPEGTSAQAASAIGLALTDCANILAASDFDWAPQTRQGAIRREIVGSITINPLTTRGSKRRFFVQLFATK